MKKHTITVELQAIAKTKAILNNVFYGITQLKRGTIECIYMKIYNVTLEACLEIEAENPSHAIALARALFDCDAQVLLRPTYVWTNEYKKTWSREDAQWFDKIDAENKIKKESQEEEAPF